MKRIQALRLLFIPAKGHFCYWVNDVNLYLILIQLLTLL